jgi:membrane protease YdiL (CAAX protease family)
VSAPAAATVPAPLPAPPVPAPPPAPPELPEGVDPFPRWPLWYGPFGIACGFATGIVGAIMLALPMLGIAAVTEADFEDTLPALGELATVVQDVGLVAIAVLLADRTGPPRAWHFGLRRPPAWPALGWAVVALAVFWVFVLPLELLPEGPSEEISPKVGLALLLIVGTVLIVVAPVAEEFFFRGFFYRSLRSRMPVLPAAAVDGMVFGLLHAPNGLIAVPLISILGFLMCLLYERTGSLYPCIAVHAAHNTLVALLGSDAAAGTVFAAIGAVTVAACFVVAARTRSRDPLVLRAEAAAA